MVPFACMPSPIPRQDRWKLVRSYDSINFGLPRNRGGSAPALVFSRPAQRSLALRPACLPSRHCDLLHQRLQQSRCLHCCSDCYRVERTSSRAGFSRCGPPPFTTHPIIRLTKHLEEVSTSFTQIVIRFRNDSKIQTPYWVDRVVGRRLPVRVRATAHSGFFRTRG
jgi:hypothetical protein